MADIFGREREDYALVRALDEAKAWERYQAQNAQRRQYAEPQHSFLALEAGVPDSLKRATEDAQALGYLTNNLLAIQTAIDEIMYTAYRLPMFVSINTSIPEGARSYGVRVHNRVGRAKRVSAPGYEAPSATVSETIATQDLFLYGLDAEWSVDELRGAMMTGVALDTESLDAAVMGALEEMEAVGLTGSEYEDKGLLNLPITGTDSVNRAVSAVNWSTSTAAPIRSQINGVISQVIEDSKETLGRNLNQGMTVYLPGKQYDQLTDLYVGDNADKTLMRSILEDNPWTHFTGGSPLMIQRVLELATAAAGNKPRMVVTLKDTRVAEMGVSISPRILSIQNKGRVICGQVEAKFSSLFVKRPKNIYYIDDLDG